MTKGETRNLQNSGGRKTSLDYMGSLLTDLKAHSGDVSRDPGGQLMRPTIHFTGEDTRLGKGNVLFTLVSVLFLLAIDRENIAIW